MSLFLSIAALLAGPFVYALGQRNLAARQFLEGFVFITIAGIVCVHIVPSALAAGGGLALLFLLLGLGFPVALERIFDRAVHQAHSFILFIAALGLIIHALIDGIALTPPAAESVEGQGLMAALWSNQLALGVILHRLPVGMAIWWSLRPQFGHKTAIMVFAVIIIATAISYSYAGPIVAMTESRSLAYFQSFVAGSLVHIVAFGVSHTHDHPVEAHPPPRESMPRMDDWGYRLGILVGMFLVFTLPQLHGGADG
jgi:zinc transporter ZupT